MTRAAHSYNIRMRMVRLGARPSALAMHMNARLFRFGINLWPPFLFTGIHVTRVSPDYRQIDVELASAPGTATTWAPTSVAACLR